MAASPSEGFRILSPSGLGGDQGCLGALDHRSQMADLLSATATIPEQLPATAEQLIVTAEQQTCILSPQPYAPDKQGPADFQTTQLQSNGISTNPLKKAAPKT